MEEMESLFDNCDKAHSGKVSVSTLILAVRKEVSKGKDLEMIVREEALTESVRNLLDPLNQDKHIDKATWVKAWQRQVDSPGDCKLSGKMARQSSDSDDVNLMDTSNDGHGFLDQSKQSYCFSPGSHSSSTESEPEELSVLKQENRQLHSNLKCLKVHLQTHEDALVQEQVEKQELEKSLKIEITRLTKQNNNLQKSLEDLKLSFDTSEKEKLDLCKNIEQLYVVEKQLRMTIASQILEIESLNSEVNDLSKMKDSFKLQNDQLRSELEQQAHGFRDQLTELHEALKTCLAERNEMRSTIEHSLYNKRDLAARLEECEYPSIQAEVDEVHISSESTERDVLPSNVKILNDNAFLSDPQSLASSTPRDLHHRTPALATSASLLEELQAVDSFLHSGSDLDCSFDVVQSSPVQQTNGTNDNEGGISHLEESAQMQDVNHFDLCSGFTERNKSMKPLLPSSHEVSSISHFLNNERGQGDFTWNGRERMDQCTQTEIYNRDREIQVICCASVSHQSTQTKTEDSPNDEVHSTVNERKELVPPKVAPLNFRCTVWPAISCICLFLFLLVISTVIFTAAVLDVASQSGVFPSSFISGSAPKWVKFLVQPFVRIDSPKTNLV